MTDETTTAELLDAIPPETWVQVTLAGFKSPDPAEICKVPAGVTLTERDLRVIYQIGMRRPAYLTSTGAYYDPRLPRVTYESTDPKLWANITVGPP